jgi:single-strand DNA-binding protein
LATNRSWKTDSGEKHDEAEFHNIVAWNKLAELCSQFLVKGRKVYLEGRLSTRTWTGQDGASRNRTEIVISDMILLDSRPAGAATVPSEPTEEAVEVGEIKQESKAKVKKETKKEVKEKEEAAPEPPTEEVVPDDIPF